MYFNIFFTYNMKNQTISITEKTSKDIQEEKFWNELTPKEVAEIERIAKEDEMYSYEEFKKLI